MLVRSIRTKLGWLKRQILQQYYSFVKAEIINIQGIKLKLDRHISEPVRKVIYHGDYEKQEFRILRSRLNPDDVVMEVGSGLGFLSTYCAKKIGSDKVFTYEANPDLEPHIRNTYKINNVNPTLEICLVGDTNGESDFYQSKDFWWSSAVRHDENGTKIKVPMKAFNQEVQRINPTFLLIDIEGGEYELVQNADFYNVK